MRIGFNVLPKKEIPAEFTRCRLYTVPLAAYSPKYVYEGKPIDVYSFLYDIMADEPDIDFIVGDNIAQLVLIRENRKNFKVGEKFVIYFLSGMYASEGYDSLKYDGYVVSEASLEQEIMSLAEEQASEDFDEPEECSINGEGVS